MKESSAKKLVFSGLVIIILLGIAVLTVPHETEEKTVTITVSAASSLTEAFGDISREFETSYPNTKVELNLAGSGTLRTQIESGAPVDVFASASESDMDLLSEKGLIQNASRKDFAANTLVMIVPAKADSESPETLEDLTGDNIEKIAIGNPESAPVGKYTKQVLEAAGLWEKIQNKVILAENVKQVLTYVETGEADTGFVYVTDARNEKKNLSKIVYTVPVNEPISYPIAIVKPSKNEKEAQKFVDFVTGSRGQEILTKYGFKLP